MPLSADIARWALGLRYDRLPPEAAAAAKRAIVDTIGCAVAGWSERCVRILRDLYGAPAIAGASLPGGEWMPLPGGGRASLLGRGPAPLLGGGWAPLEQAALINGTAAHALDYDDVCLTVTTHPSAAIVPAVLAAGYAAHRRGADAITAYLAGVEVSTRVGQVMGFTHYQLGWHATETLGAIGAAVAAGYLLGLSADQMVMALGIAGSLAGGLRRNFGTMTKPLHAGLAAESGVRAALLAARGFTADADIFGPGGYFHAFSGGSAHVPGALPLGEPFDVLASGLAVKMFPCCYATHRLIDGALTLARTHDLKPDDVARVEIVGPPGAFTPLNRPRPATGLEGKFSAEYTAAAAIVDRQVSLGTFTDAAVQRPAVQELLRRVTVREEPGNAAALRGLDDGEVRVTVLTRSGRRLEYVVSYPPGAPQRPPAESELWAKFQDCLRTAGTDPAAAEALFAACLSLERADDLAEFWQYVAAVHGKREGLA